MSARLSSAAALLLRALIDRAGVANDRIILRSVRSVDWQSLTFVGERHEFALSITPPDAAVAAARLTLGLADAEWALAGHWVPDIAVAARSVASDGSILIAFEALTLKD